MEKVFPNRSVSPTTNIELGCWSAPIASLPTYSPGPGAMSYGIGLCGSYRLTCTRLLFDGPMNLLVAIHLELFDLVIS
jgi:hypothetical protein